MDLSKYDISALIYAALAIAVIAWSTVYGLKDDGWWEGLSNFTPGWGNSQALIIIISIIWYSSAMISIFLLHRNDTTSKSANNKVIYYSMAVLISILAGGQMYSLSDAVENFKEAFYMSLISIIAVAFIVYLAYRRRGLSERYNDIALWSSVVALITGAYLTIWTYKIKHNAGE